MALPTLHHRPARRPHGAGTPPPGDTSHATTPPPAPLPAAARELVLTAPMLLFAHGILVWIDDLGQHGRSGVIWFLAQAALIASAFSFVGLAAGLRHQIASTASRQTAMAARAALVAGIAGTGLTAWVALVRGIGGATATTGAPLWLLAAGPALLAGAVLALLALARRVLALPARAIALGATGAVLLALPLDLIPLAGIVILLALEPLLGSDPAGLEGDGRVGAR